MIPSTYKPKKKFMQLAIAEAKRARDRGDYAIGAVIPIVTRLSAALLRSRTARRNHRQYSAS
jgi:hypothetical protein